MSDTCSAALPTSFGAADRIGAAASFLCTLHCAALPAMAASIPAVSVGLLAGHGFERGFVLCAAVFALFALYSGLQRHGVLRAFWFLLPGIALLLLGAWSPLHRVEPLHTILVTLGGSLVAVAHLVNLRLSQRHAHDSRCAH